MNEELFLETPVAKRLYHEVAEELPIIDYHNHLSVRELTSGRPCADLDELWVAHDPYKHRAMRMAGVPETLITGKETKPFARFQAWAETLSETLGNPLYLWSVLELKRVFGIETLLTAETAESVWEQANATLHSLTARNLLARFRVEELCPANGFLDSLDDFPSSGKVGETEIYPSLRADDLLAFSADDGRTRIDALEGQTDMAVHSLADFLEALKKRLDVFGTKGTRLADHALDTFAYPETFPGEFTLGNLFSLYRSGNRLTNEEAAALTATVLRFLAGEYGRRRWVMQLHIGAQRVTSSRLRRLAGPAGGYAGIGADVPIDALCRFLDDVEKDGYLPRVILYPLNPSAMASLAVLSGSFTEDGVPGKIQLGPAWWYNDHASGIRNQLENLAAYGLLSVFIGMTTDSRSLLSLCRHEFFRRVFCGWVGEQASRGLLPDDFETLSALVRGLSYGNARKILFPSL